MTQRILQAHFSAVSDLPTTWLRLENLPVPLDCADDPMPRLKLEVAKRLSVDAQGLSTMAVTRRALDARGRHLCYRFSVDVAVSKRLADTSIKKGRAVQRPQLARRKLRLMQPPQGPRPVVAGAGPAGLFAALTLARAGWPPIILERGKPVERRGRDVSALYSRGVLDEDSNVCFGEGGAGTYSDGKLYTRIGDARIAQVLEDLVAQGAPAGILVDARPHIGTDRLVRLLKAMRQTLLALGATFHFDTSLARLELKDGKMCGLYLKDGSHLPCRQLVLATGHSAREIWYHLESLGLPLACRPFAVGLRVEHPQALINHARYGRAASGPHSLPAADYRLAHNEPGEAANTRRSAFSFCMCPGGVVVTTPTTPEQLCINGMSHAARQGQFANSAMVVSCDVDDFARAGFTGTFAGLQFQEAIEHRAYRAGGGHFVAPAQRVGDFVKNQMSTSLPGTSYRRGLTPHPLAALFPETLSATLKRALVRFADKLPGFVTNEATLIGVETRTASPVRLLRDDDGTAHGAKGLYPAGEGMGYGGGIVSAAVDGMRAAEAMLTNHGAAAEEHVL